MTKTDDATMSPSDTDKVVAHLLGACHSLNSASALYGRSTLQYNRIEAIRTLVALTVKEIRGDN